MEKITQRRFLQGRQECRLIDQERVRIHTQRWGAHNEVEFPLSVVRDSYDRQRIRPLHWLLWAAVFAISGLLPLVLWNLQAERVLLVLVAIAATLSCSSIALYFLLSTDQLIFRHHETGKLLFTLWADRPQRQLVNEFTDHLFDYASAARRSPDLSDEQRLSVYRDYLQYLHNEAVLTYEEASGIYQRARLQLVARRRAQIQAVE